MNERSELPDFLRLADDEVDAERRRQDRLRRDFNSRARMTGAETEAARALLIEQSLRDSLALDHAPDEKDRIANQLAENLSLQGRFLEAAGTAVDPDAVNFYAKAAHAVFDGAECPCGDRIETAGGTRIRLPKAHTVKEIYSIPKGRFVFLLECGTCACRYVSDSGPAVRGGSGENDLERLKI